MAVGYAVNIGCTVDVGRAVEEMPQMQRDIWGANANMVPHSQLGDAYCDRIGLYGTIDGFSLVIHRKLNYMALKRVQNHKY